MLVAGGGALVGCRGATGSFRHRRPRRTDVCVCVRESEVREIGGETRDDGSYRRKKKGEKEGYEEEKKRRERNETGIRLDDRYRVARWKCEREESPVIRSVGGK